MYICFAESCNETDDYTSEKEVCRRVILQQKQGGNHKTMACALDVMFLHRSVRSSTVQSVLQHAQRDLRSCWRCWQKEIFSLTALIFLSFYSWGRHQGDGCVWSCQLPGRHVLHWRHSLASEAPAPIFGFWHRHLLRSGEEEPLGGDWEILDGGWSNGVLRGSNWWCWGKFKNPSCKSIALCVGDGGLHVCVCVCVHVCVYVYVCVRVCLDQT